MLCDRARKAYDIEFDTMKQHVFKLEIDRTFGLQIVR